MNRQRQGVVADKGRAIQSSWRGQAKHPQPGIRWVKGRAAADDAWVTSP